MNRNISDKDKKDWEKFISGNEKISDKDVKIQKSNNPETRSIDLHGYSLEKANLTIKGDLIKQVFVTSTMGVSYKLKLDKSL